MDTKPQATRPDYFALKPEVVGRLRALTRDFDSFSIDKRLRAVVELRVSQLNGCAYCTDLHSREARAHGERQQRLDALPVWRESAFFTAREKVLLDWAESLTHATRGPAADSLYAALEEAYGQVEAVEWSLCISLANFWNRMASNFKKLPAELS